MLNPDSNMTGYIRTSSGKKFYPLVCDPSQIEIEDIATGLSNTCRYAGQFSEGLFYSVARHSILVSRYVPPEIAMKGLLHDAAEAYIGDVIKSAKIGLPDYRGLEAAIHECICSAIGIGTDIPAEVKYWDNLVMKAEYYHFWPHFYEEDFGESKPEFTINSNRLWSSSHVDKYAFLVRYQQILQIQ